jgi:hypothetical protein
MNATKSLMRPASRAVVRFPPVAARARGRGAPANHGVIQRVGGDNPWSDPPWTRDGLIRSVEANRDELKAFAQRKIASQMSKMDKDYLKFSTNHRPSGDMVCTLMWEAGASYNQCKWGLSGGFLSAAEKRQLRDTSDKAHSCGETDVLLKYPDATFVFAMSFNSNGALPPCSRCKHLLRDRQINWAP